MVSAVSGASSSVWTLEKQSATSLANSIFATVDTNNKGYIDKAALTTALSGSDSSSADIDAAFSELDQDGDGKITKSELSSSIDQLSQALSAQFSQSRVDSARANAGANGGSDPGFTKDELSAIAADSNTDAKQSALITKLAANFSAADTNSDGRIDGKEAMAYAKLTSTDADSGSDTQVASSSATHAHHAHGAGGPPPASASADSSDDSSDDSSSSSSSTQTYAAADTNQDGTVSLDELLAYETKQDSANDSSTVSSTQKDDDAAKRMLMQLMQAYGVSNSSSGSSATSTVASSESLSAYA